MERAIAIALNLSRREGSNVIEFSAAESETLQLV